MGGVIRAGSTLVLVDDLLNTAASSGRLFSVAKINNESDPVKDEANREKHCVSLALAQELDSDVALVCIDARFHCDEMRRIAQVASTGILHFVAFVDRGKMRSIFNLQRANRPEVNHRGQNN